MDMTKLSSMNIKQLEALFANTLPESINHDLIKPVLEAKRRDSDSRRTWTIAFISATIAIVGIVVAYLNKTKHNAKRHKASDGKVMAKENYQMARTVRMVLVLRSWSSAARSTSVPNRVARQK